LRLSVEERGEELRLVGSAAGSLLVSVAVRRSARRRGAGRSVGLRCWVAFRRWCASGPDVVVLSGSAD